MHCRVIHGLVLIFLAGPIVCAEGYNPPERIRVLHADGEGNIERPLRYRPEDSDFVIRNGKESFNRPLYGGNTAFRIDAGDLPEFSFYLPRHGGVVRFGMKTEKGTKWLLDAESVVSRYRPGSMIYEINDSLLGDSRITLTVMGLYRSEGLISKIEISGDSEVDLVIAFGGIGGRRGKRSGDIGCESEPVSQFFQLKPEYCKDNQISIQHGTFSIESRWANYTGALSQTVQWSMADSMYWNTIGKLIISSDSDIQLPVVIGLSTLSEKNPVYFGLQRYRQEAAALDSDKLPVIFDSAENQRRAIAERVKVETPDPYINAAVSALCIAADAIWDEDQGSVMHGAVAWRSKYLGWRGPYANDAFGWHDRSRRHLTYWAGRQNTSPVPDKILPADPTANLSRNEPSLHSNGDMSGKHYDMNLVYMDALFRYILWTGDLELAEKLWPVIERHMAWERRLFRRPFGEDKLPLYEAYAAIWASDDLQYHGGGVTHASAYNYYHNRMVGRLAELLGKDGSAYKKEADLILQGMRKYLWLSDRGWYGEWKDLLGLQFVHPNAALWTFYHTLDSEVPNPVEAWQMSRFVDTQIAHIPVFGDDILEGKYYTLPTTSWMPYTWSTNNVVMAEVAHTALAYWQAGRSEKAYSILKGCMLDSMYMGTCPGNAGMTSFFDMARGEAQRDFGDAIGTCSRAIIEGLFGIRPDVLSAQLKVFPGFPDSWDYATIKHPDFSFSYSSKENLDTYLVKPAFSKPMALEMQVKAKRTEIKSVMINGKQVKWTSVNDGVGCPQIQFSCGPADQYEVNIFWDGSKPTIPKNIPVVAQGKPFEVNFGQAELVKVSDPQDAIHEQASTKTELNATTVGRLGHRTLFAELKQGQMTWLQPVSFEIREPFEIITTSDQSTDSICFQVRNNTAAEIKSKAVIKICDSTCSVDMKMSPFGTTESIILSTEKYSLVTGSNRIYVELESGQLIEGIVTNWHIKSATRLKWDVVDLKEIYNDKVIRIFQNEYLSPRSPYCSLAIPKQGIGSWCNYAKTFEVDDQGVRQAASKNNGIFNLLSGIPFRVPVDEKENNVVFTSQWDNYPDQSTVKLKGKASHIYLLMVGSTNSMQSRFENGRVIVTYSDETTETLALVNPTTWWPIDQDYFIDDYAFRYQVPIPPRVHLKTGQVKIYDPVQFKRQGGRIEGGAATVLDMPLNPKKQLKTLTIQTIANEVVIGLMSAALVK